MIEMDMEVEATRSHSHMDDDFIDFDTDMAEIPQSKTSGSEKLAHIDVDKNDDVQDVQHLNENIQVEAMDSGADIVDISIAEESMVTVIEVDETNQANGPDSGVQLTENPGPGEYVQVHNDDRASSHEIDYENEDGTEKNEVQDKFEADVDDYTADEHLDDSVTHPGTADVIEKDEEQVTGLQAGTGRGIDQEITWDEEAEQGEEAEQDEKERDEAEQDEEERDEEERDEEERDEDAIPDEEADAEIDSKTNAMEEHTSDEPFSPTAHVEEYEKEQVESGVENEIVESSNPFDGNSGEHSTAEESQGNERTDVHSTVSASDHEPAAAIEPGYPSVTVQYKGDEFSLFSTSSDGFFSDITILDDTMGTLLAEFHKELVNEIAQEDELVFQVDELGLEFAESSSQDSLSTVTLREILEIFDLLVQNQDPDSSRTLYTYLFTRPSTARRLETLIEAATNGKGLDEVIHLFEPIMPNNTSPAEANDPGHVLDEHFDDYGSLDEETAGNEEQDAEPAGEAMTEEDELQRSTPKLDHSDDQNAPEIEDGDHHGGGHDTDVETEEIVEDAEEAADVAASEHAETDDHPTSESDPFVRLELDEEAELNDATEEPDNQAQSKYQSHEPNAASEDIADTSASSTLRGEDEAASVNVDITADVDEDESMAMGVLNEAPVDAAIANDDDDDELAEIDWREAPEVESHVAGTPCGVGKRTRPQDDELDMDNEKDVKRRRS